MGFQNFQISPHYKIHVFPLKPLNWWQGHNFWPNILIFLHSLRHRPLHIVAIRRKCTMVVGLNGTPYPWWWGRWLAVFPSVVLFLVVYIGLKHLLCGVGVEVLFDLYASLPHGLGGDCRFLVSCPGSWQGVTSSLLNRQADHLRECPDLPG